MHRDVRQQFIIVGWLQSWNTISVRIPRCRRCAIGHGVERTLCYVAFVSAFFTAMLLLSLTTSAPWDDKWQLVIPVAWTLAWLSLWLIVRLHWLNWSRLAPRPIRYARRYPAIQELAGEGWQHRGRP